MNLQSSLYDVYHKKKRKFSKNPLTLKIYIIIVLKIYCKLMTTSQIPDPLYIFLYLANIMKRTKTFYYSDERELVRRGLIMEKKKKELLLVTLLDLTVGTQSARDKN